MYNIILLQKYCKHILYLYKNIKRTFIKNIKNTKQNRYKTKYFKKIFFKLSNARLKKLKNKKFKNKLLTIANNLAVTTTANNLAVTTTSNNLESKIKPNGVFRKLHQPAASPAAPHLKQALLGAAEYNIKFCVFAGRQKNIEILHTYIELALEKAIINEYHIFDFSRNMNDHNFLKIEYERLTNIYNIKNNIKNRIYLHNYSENEINIKLEILQSPNWNPFYKEISENSNEKDIIIKCDDDILFIDVCNLENIINDRINDRVPFLIHSNCINNGVCAYYQKDIFKNLTENLSIYPKGGILGVLFEKPEIAYSMHNEFINDMLLSKFTKINKYIIDDVYINTRISINFILIHGSDAKYLKDITADDEYQLSSLIPEKLLRPNKIKGDFLTAHLSYNMQEKIMFNKDKILNGYKKILEIYLESELNIKNNIEKVVGSCKKLPINLVVPKPNIVNFGETFSATNQEIFSVKNWIKDNHYYIKNVDSNQYLYIDFINDELILSDKKILFEVNIIEELNNKKYYGVFRKLHQPAESPEAPHLKQALLGAAELLIGIYYLTKFNYKGNFSNKNLIIQCLKDKNERIIVFDELDENNICYIKFLKYNNYLSINKNIKNSLEISKLKETKWKLEKANYGVFHKLQQPSVSPAAPHPEQALLGAAENNNDYIKVTRFLKDNKYYYKNIETEEIYTNYYLGWGYENILSI
jgi:hypothetical protein